VHNKAYVHVMSDKEINMGSVVLMQLQVWQRIKYTQHMLQMDQQLLALWNISHRVPRQTSCRGAANVATPNSSSSVLFFGHLVC
jgi:hypothetical protein